MKKRTHHLFLTVALLGLAALTQRRATAAAQTTAFTYQGRLTSGAGNANGSYDLRFAVYDANVAGNFIAGPVTNAAVAVSNGLFTVQLDFGPGVFTGTNYWVELAVRTNDGGSFLTLEPRQQLTPTPYAIFASTAGNVSGSVPATQLSGTIANGNLPASPSFSGTVTAGAYGGNGANLTTLNANNLASGTVPLAQLSGMTSNQLDAATWQLATNLDGGNAAALNGLNATNFWQLGGNNVSSGQFLGSTNNQAVTIKVYGMQALQLQPVINAYGYSNIVNLVGGSPLNYIAPGVSGSVIAGGGADRLDGSAGFGNSNSVFSDMSSVGGGMRNAIQANSSSSVISGGQGNAIGQYADHSSLGGGYFNSIQGSASYSFLGGGNGNSIQLSANNSFLGGGSGNSIQTNASRSVLGGGSANLIQANNSFLGSGQNNSILAGNYSVLGGGSFNQIQLNAQYSVIGGGEGNSIQTNADHCFIGGGYQNSIQSGARYCAIAGGGGNSIQSGASYSFIGGGSRHSIPLNAQNATILGGDACIANYYSLAAGDYAWATNTGSFVWSDATATITPSVANNSVTMRASGGFRFFTGTGTSGAQLAAGATAWSVLSDRDQKKDFAAVDVVNILDKLAGIPVTQWHYKWEDQNITPHIGPMAQDFKHAFYPGSDDKSISTLEADGVAFAAIQGLNQKLEETRTENAVLKARLEKLEKWIESRNGEAK